MRGRNQRIIDTERIAENYRKIRNIVPSPTGIISVVKADGYGHGAVRTAKTVIREGTEMLAVASVSEGVELRENGISDTPILVLGAVMKSDVEAGVRSGLILTVCSAEMVDLCEKAAVDNGVESCVHLKVDTGMGRIGIRDRDELDLILSALHRCPHVHLEGVFTHFSDADGDDEGIRYTFLQYQRFNRLTACLPGSVIRHCSNTAAILRMPEMKMDMVRLGIGLYGYSPVTGGVRLDPCMKWVAQVSYIKTLLPGEYVSYGRSFQTDKNSEIATITCGYADGYHREATHHAEVLIHGKRYPIVGKICMDQMMADITGSDGIRPGDEVILMGKSEKESIDAQDIARWSHTIPYEVLVNAGRRVERVYEHFEW